MYACCLLNEELISSAAPHTLRRIHFERAAIAEKLAELPVPFYEL